MADRKRFISMYLDYVLHAYDAHEAADSGGARRIGLGVWPRGGCAEGRG